MGISWEFSWELDLNGMKNKILEVLSTYIPIYKP